MPQHPGSAQGAPGCWGWTTRVPTRGGGVGPTGAAVFGHGKTGTQRETPRPSASSHGDAAARATRGTLVTGIALNPPACYAGIGSRLEQGHHHHCYYSLVPAGGRANSFV